MSIFPIVRKSEVEEFFDKKDRLKKKHGVDFERELANIESRLLTNPYFQIKEEYDRLIGLLRGI